MLKGVVKSGVGEGAMFMAMEHYALGMEEELGFAPYKGTLNLQANKEEAQRFIGSLQKQYLPGFTKGTKKFGGVKLYPCHIKHIQAAIVVPEYTRYDLSTVEIIAEPYLRSALKLKDGDQVTLTP